MSPARAASRFPLRQVTARTRSSTGTVRTLLLIWVVLIPVRVPAWLLIAGWFLLQLVSGVASLSPSAGAAAGDVAYWAHVGGFLTGVLLIWLLRQPERLERVRAHLAQPQ